MHPSSASFPLLVNQYFKTTNANLKFISFFKKSQPRLQCHSNSRVSVHSSNSGIPWKGKAVFPAAGMLSTSQLVLFNPAVQLGWVCSLICIVFTELPFMARRRIQTGGKRRRSGESWMKEITRSQTFLLYFAFYLLKRAVVSFVLLWMGAHLLQRVQGSPVPAQLLACSAQTSPSASLAPSKHK